MQLLLYIEQMQTQQRAEAGIREKIVGYVGEEGEEELEELPSDLLAAFGAVETTYEGLPDDIRDIVLAENHRLQTGETLSVEAFKERSESKLNGE